MEKWTGQIDRPLRVWTNPKLTDDIYLHFSEVLRDIKRFAPHIKGKVIDFGAGKAPYRNFFRNAREYVRVDDHVYAGTDIQADITKKIPVKSGSFDSALCIQVLEHVSKPQKVTNEIYRVLKKGGTCLLTTHMAAPLHGEPYDYYRFTKHALRDLFKKFSRVHIKESGGAALSIMQLIVWGISEKLPRVFSMPLIVFFNILGRLMDRIFYSNVFTINYSVFAEK